MNSDKENLQFSPNEVRLTELSHSEVGHDYRLKKITEIQMSLEEERIRRRRLYENYYRIVTWVNNSDAVLIAVSMALGVAGVGLLSTIVAAPVVVALEILASFRFSHRTSATTSDVIVIPLRMRELVPRVPCQIQTTGDGANFPDFTSS